MWGCLNHGAPIDTASSAASVQTPQNGTTEVCAIYGKPKDTKKKKKNAQKHHRVYCCQMWQNFCSLIGPAVRADFRRLYPANAKTPTCCPSDDNRTKVTNSVTSARSLWWHVGPARNFGPRSWRGRRTPLSIWMLYSFVTRHTSTIVFAAHRWNPVLAPQGHTGTHPLGGVSTPPPPPLHWRGPQVTEETKM